MDDGGGRFRARTSADAWLISRLGAVDCTLPLSSSTSLTLETRVTTGDISRVIQPFDEICGVIDSTIPSVTTLRHIRRERLRSGVGGVGDLLLAEERAVGTDLDQRRLVVSSYGYAAAR